MESLSLFGWIRLKVAKKSSILTAGYNKAIFIRELQTV